MNPKKEDKVQDDPCKYEIINDGSNINLIMRCMECSGNHNLSDTKCRNKILKILRQQHTVDNIIIQQLQETQHFERSMEIILEMKDILETLDTFALRDPRDSYPKDQSIQRACSKCVFLPKKLFTRLDSTFKVDIVKFLKEMKDISRTLKNPSATKHCNDCISESAHDLNSIMDRYERMTSSILKNAYYIDIDLEKV